MTEKLYESDGYLRSFSATVLSCSEEHDAEAACWLIELDRTAFFPEGGGQNADTGTLDGVRITDVRDRSGTVLHRAEAPLPVGAEVHGELDWQQRFRRMQNHSGEHILSGLANKLFGYQNVGFHLGDADVTVDFDGELTREQLAELERLANLAVAENVTVRTWYPTPAALKRLQYRSKLALTEHVRIVKIPGYDICACCAPHVRRTGEIGVIKILDSMRHRGGMRLHILCGLAALEDYDRRYLATLELSGLLSVPQLETPEAVRRLQAKLADTQAALAELKRQRNAERLAALPETSGNLCLFETDGDLLALRELVNGGMAKCGGVCAGFCGQDGDWKYILGSRTVDLRRAGKEINAALNGRGGGKREMIQGSAAATRAEIEAFFASFGV